MKPAFSVIFLTTLIGAGQGLFMALVAGQFYWVIGAAPRTDDGLFYAGGSLLALALLSGGLIASFFHLAHPERAWRAASQWRTSWLSREVIALPVMIAAVAVYGTLHWLGWQPVLLTFGNLKTLDLTMAAGYLGVAAALTLFVCTGMIYAAMKFIQEWATPLTVLNYTLMGMASGFLLAATYADAMNSPLTGFLITGALGLTILALAGRLASLWRNGRIKHLSSLQSAVGMHHRNLRQISRGFTADAFNLREFFHPGGPNLLRRLKTLFLLAAFLVPILLLALALAGDAPALLLGPAFAIQYLGLLAERWVFFAEANHPQNLYYQRVA